MKANLETLSEQLATLSPALRQEQAALEAGVPSGDPVSVTITAGSAVTDAGNNEWRVAKKALVSTLSVLVHGDRLRVSKALPEAAVLLRELSTFSHKIDPATANESFESWRENQHDDLVLAVALACWWGECPQPVAGGFCTVLRW